MDIIKVQIKFDKKRRFFRTYSVNFLKINDESKALYGLGAINAFFDFFEDLDGR